MLNKHGLITAGFPHLHSCAIVHYLFYKLQQVIQNEIKKTILFTTVSKRIKYLRINLTKELKFLYNGHYKTLLRENTRTQIRDSCMLMN